LGLGLGFFLPAVESCGGGHGIHSRTEEVCLSTPGKERSMTMVTFLLSSVERAVEVFMAIFQGIGPSSPKKEKVMTMVIFLLPSVEICGGGHGASSREEEVCPSYS
jgi:hypothetical protein